MRISIFAKSLTSTVSVLCASALSASALEIVFDYSYDDTHFFPVGSDERAMLEAAGAFYSEVITDSLAALIPVSPFLLNIEYRHPATGVIDWHVSDGIAADTILIYVGARNLPGNRLGSATFGGWDGLGDDPWLDLLDTRGQTGDFSTPNANEVSTWGGSIAFDTKKPDGTIRTWDTSADGSNPLSPHLFSIAVHEIAHVLGFGLTDSWFDQESGNVFLGTKSQAVYGGPVPLEITTPAHWDEDVTSTVYGTSIVQETAMDPFLDGGTISPMTLLDLAALDDIGWDIAAPPVQPVVPSDLAASTLDGDDFQLTWTGNAAFDYQVESATDFEKGSWLNEGAKMPGVDDTMTLSQAVDGAKHFRIRVTAKAEESLQASPAVRVVDQEIPHGSLRSRMRRSRDVNCNCYAR